MNLENDALLELETNITEQKTSFIKVSNNKLFIGFLNFVLFLDFQECVQYNKLPIVHKINLDNNIPINMTYFNNYYYFITLNTQLYKMKDLDNQSNCTQVQLNYKQTIFNADFFNNYIYLATSGTSVIRLNLDDYNDVLQYDINCYPIQFIKTDSINDQIIITSYKDVCILDTDLKQINQYTHKVVNVDQQTSFKQYMSHSRVWCANQQYCGNDTGQLIFMPNNQAIQLYDSQIRQIHQYKDFLILIFNNAAIIQLNFVEFQQIASQHVMIAQTTETVAKEPFNQNAIEFLFQQKTYKFCKSGVVETYENDQLQESVKLDQVSRVVQVFEFQQTLICVHNNNSLSTNINGFQPQSFEIQQNSIFCQINDQIYIFQYQLKNQQLIVQQLQQVCSQIVTFDLFKFQITEINIKNIKLFKLLQNDTLITLQLNNYILQFQLKPFYTIITTPKIQNKEINDFAFFQNNYYCVSDDCLLAVYDQNLKCQHQFQFKTPLKHISQNSPFQIAGCINEFFTLKMRQNRILSITHSPYVKQTVCYKYTSLCEFLNLIISGDSSGRLLLFSAKKRIDLIFNVELENVLFSLQKSEFRQNSIYFGGTQKSGAFVFKTDKILEIANKLENGEIKLGISEIQKSQKAVLENGKDYFELIHLKSDLNEGSCNCVISLFSKKSNREVVFYGFDSGNILVCELLNSLYLHQKCFSSYSAVLAMSAFWFREKAFLVTVGWDRYLRIYEIDFKLFNLRQIRKRSVGLYQLHKMQVCDQKLIIVGNGILSITLEDLINGDQ